MADATPTATPAKPVVSAAEIDAQFPAKPDPKSGKARKRVAGPDGGVVACAKCKGTGLTADELAHCPACNGCGHELTEK